MTKNVLVTGGAGFIGSFLVDALVEFGHNVRILDNLEPQVHGSGKKAPAYLNPHAEFILGDVRDRDKFADVLKDVEIIFHEAAAVGVGQSMYQVRKYVETNTLGIANFLDISDFPDVPTKKRVNIKMGCYQLGTARILNGLSFNNRYSRKILSSIFQTDKKLSLQIPDNLTELWSLSNQNTKLITGLNLEKYSYPMVNS